MRKNPTAAPRGAKTGPKTLPQTGGRPAAPRARVTDSSRGYAGRPMAGTTGTKPRRMNSVKDFAGRPSSGRRGDGFGR